MQGTGANGSDDGGGEWERIGKKGKKEGLQASSKKGKKNSMKNARTLSLQAFYTEHGMHFLIIQLFKIFSSRFKISPRIYVKN